jgi:hypothetical protein
MAWRADVLCGVSQEAAGTDGCLWRAVGSAKDVAAWQLKVGEAY